MIMQMGFIQVGGYDGLIAVSQQTSDKLRAYGGGLLTLKLIHIKLRDIFNTAYFSCNLIRATHCIDNLHIMKYNHLSWRCCYGKCIFSYG